LSEAYLQILLILAYLSIGLISVTFPIFTICVTYLRQEFRETKKEQKKRVEKLREKLAKLTKELSGKWKDIERFKEIQRLIKSYKGELQGLETRLTHLTAIGAVLAPIIFLAIALLSACIGIYFFYQGSGDLVNFSITGSVMFSGAALYYLYKTISAVEYAALRRARTIEFEISFYPSKEETQQVKLGETSQLSIGTRTHEDSVDDLVMYVMVPSELEIERSTSHETRCSYYEDRCIVFTKRAFLFRASGVIASFLVVPKKIGKHTVEVKVGAKGIYENKKELTVNVVK